jgi:hypothetical protein
MKSLRQLLGGVATAFALASPLGAQQITLNFDDLGSCAGGVSTYGGWLAIASGVNCQTGPSYFTSAHSAQNYLRSGGSMNWQFSGGPVVFNGMYASGYGTFFVELLRNGSTVYASQFNAYGSGHVLAGAGYSGDVDQVKIGLVGGLAHLGIDDISFTPFSNPPPPPPEDDPIDDLVNEANATPEPATLLLVASGLGGVGAMMRRRRKSSK